MTGPKLLPATTAMLATLIAGAPVQAQEPSDTAPPDFWHRDTLTGDWGSRRAALADQGIAISAAYTAEVFANVQGGIKRGATYDGLFLPQVEIDLEKLIG